MKRRRSPAFISSLANGRPCRVGMASGNEFSDHQFEKKNYLNLAGSKLRTCALGPELVVDPDFQSVPVTILIERDGTARSGRRHSAAARLKCVTAYKTSNIIISSTRRIVARAMCTCTSSVPIA